MDLWHQTTLSNHHSRKLCFASRHCDLDTIVNFLAKQNISKLMETSPKQVKEALMSQCATILACYRKNCASPSSAGQLILPECMKVNNNKLLVVPLVITTR